MNYPHELERLKIRLQVAREDQSDPKAFKAAIELASRAACALVRAMGQSYEADFAELLKQSNTDGTGLRISDLAATNEILRMFQSPEAFEEFLGSLEQLLAVLHYDPDDIAASRRALEAVADKLPDTKWDLESYRALWSRLRKLHCGDDGGAAAPRPSGPPPPGPNWTVIIAGLALLAQFAQLGYDVYKGEREWVEQWQPAPLVAPHTPPTPPNNPWLRARIVIAVALVNLSLLPENDDPALAALDPWMLVPGMGVIASSG